MLTLTTRQIHFSFQTLLKNSLPYERKNFTASAFTNSLFPRLHCCSLALLFMYSLSSALGNALLSSSILFLAMFHKPFCAVKRPTSNSSFRLFHSFLGKSFSFDFPPFHLSVSAKNMGPSHLFGIFICLLLLLHFMQRYWLAAHSVRCFFASLFIYKDPLLFRFRLKLFTVLPFLLQTKKAGCVRQSSCELPLFLAELCWSPSVVSPRSIIATSFANSSALPLPSQ